MVIDQSKGIPKKPTCNPSKQNCPIRVAVIAVITIIKSMDSNCFSGLRSSDETTDANRRPTNPIRDILDSGIRNKPEKLPFK